LRVVSPGWLLLLALLPLVGSGLRSQPTSGETCGADEATWPAEGAAGEGAPPGDEEAGWGEAEAGGDEVAGPGGALTEPLLAGPEGR